MITKEEIIRYNEFLSDYSVKISYGLRVGLIRIYEDELLENLRHIYCGGVPASILLLTQGFANGFCYDRAHLITMGFGDDDYQTVYGSIKGLRLKPDLLEKHREGKIGDMYDDHCVALRKDKDGNEWIYDTSIGLVFNKDYYYELNDFKVRNVHNKEEIQEYLYYDFLKNSDFEKEKYVLPFIIPRIEEIMVATQVFYLEDLKREIEILKEEVNYDSLCEEVDRDMLRLGFKCK